MPTAHIPIDRKPSRVCKTLKRGGAYKGYVGVQGGGACGTSSMIGKERALYLGFSI